VIFLLNTLVLSRLTSHGSASVMEGVRSPAPAAQQSAVPFSQPTAPSAAHSAPIKAPAAPAGQNR
jgi:hypothetical protein